MSARRWKVGIVGCGKVAGALDSPRRSGPVQTHAQAWRRNPRFELAACVNPNEPRLREFQKRWSIPRGYRSLAALLERERLDVLSLCSPSEFHAAQIGEILTARNQPKVLFVEKPVCLQQRERSALLRHAENSSVRILVNHSRRFDPAHRKLRELIRSGRLGRLVEGRCVYYGGWLNNGTHLIDTLRMLLAEPLSVVSSRPAGHGRGRDANLDVELACGSAAVEIRAFDEQHYQLFETDLRFEQGRVRLLDAGFLLTAEKVRVNAWGERILSRVAGFPRKGLVSPLAEAVREIGRWLEGKTSASETGTDLTTALQTMQLLEKVHAVHPN